MIRSTWQWEVLIDILISPKDHIIGWWGRFVCHFSYVDEPTAIWLQHGYRLLNIGEAVQSGDEFLQHNCGEGGLWQKAGSEKFGMLIRHKGYTYRRRIDSLQKERTCSEKIKAKLVIAIAVVAVVVTAGLNAQSNVASISSVYADAFSNNNWTAAYASNEWAAAVSYSKDVKVDGKEYEGATFTITGKTYTNVYVLTDGKMVLKGAK